MGIKEEENAKISIRGASEKTYDILNKAEDVISNKIEHYSENVEAMSDKDCYALQTLIMTEGRLLSIRSGKDNTKYTGRQECVDMVKKETPHNL